MGTSKLMAKKKKNPYAKELMSGKYRQKKKPSKKNYDRKKSKSKY